MLCWVKPTEKLSKENWVSIEAFPQALLLVTGFGPHRLFVSRCSQLNGTLTGNAGLLASTKGTS